MKDFLMDSSLNCIFSSTTKKIFLSLGFAILNLVFLHGELVFAEEVLVDPNFCRVLVEHFPEKSIEYKSGVDVHGNPVVPADLPNNNSFHIQEVISIPLTAGLFEVLAFSTESYPFNTMKRTDINLGLLTLKNGKVFYNEQPLTNEQHNRLIALCSDSDKKQKPVSIAPQK